MQLETLKRLYAFSMAQAVSDHDGKTSGMAICGMFLVAVGGTGFLWSLFTKDNNGMIYSLAFASLGAGLLGYRKGVDGKTPDMPAIEELPCEPIQTH